MKKMILCVSMLWITNLFAQVQEKTPFTLFVKKQDSLFIAAYNNNDAIAYEHLLGIFLDKYNQLNEIEKRNFSVYNINAYYNFACLYSLQNNKNEALSYFKKSIKAGFNDYEHLLGDSDLNNIRDEKEFILQLKQLQSTNDYLYILKKGKDYNLEDKRILPVFTYQSKDDSNLILLRKTFNLDSIAGQGNEVSKILNLMYWIHDLIPHDGNKENPAIKNAMSMIATCKKERRGLNCRGLATVLNECYLAMGFKSRFVTCLPKDSLGIDLDCHVINMVYAPTLKKWLWIDPTFNAYIMNEKGDLLSIEEVRDAIINDKLLILNPDANWNRKQSETNSYYLQYYMAKNLYRLECPLNSEYNFETQAPNKTMTYIELLPLDYFKQSPYKTEQINTEKNIKTIIYKTNNPSAFWRIPN